MGTFVLIFVFLGSSSDPKKPQGGFGGTLSPLLPVQLWSLALCHPKIQTPKSRPQSPDPKIQTSKSRP